VSGWQEQISDPAGLGVDHGEGEQAATRRSPEQVMQDLHDDGLITLLPDPDLCAYCQENEREPNLPCCSTSACHGEYLKETSDARY
jgi:hypothetical protein